MGRGKSIMPTRSRLLCLLNSLVTTLSLDELVGRTDRAIDNAASAVNETTGASNDAGAKTAGPNSPEAENEVEINYDNEDDVDFKDTDPEESAADAGPTATGAPNLRPAQAQLTIFTTELQELAAEQVGGK
jgi:hypothetical protein